MADATIFVVSLLVTIVSLIWGFIYLRSRSHGSLSRCRKDFSAVQDTVTDDQRDSLIEDDKSSSSTSKPESWTSEEPSNSEALGSSRRAKNNAIDRDPLDFCGHIQREMKRTKHRLALEQIEAEMTDEQKEEERHAQRRQIEEIFKLMQNNKEEFGLSSVDEIKEQMKLYISN